MMLRGAGNEKGTIPLFTYSVFDAFDSAPPVIACTDQANGNQNFCGVTNDKGEEVYDCGLCRALSKQVMTK